MNEANNWCDAVFKIVDSRVRGIITRRFIDDTFLLSIKYKSIEIGFEIDNVPRLVAVKCPPQLAAKKITKSYEKIIRRLFIK